MRSTVSVIALLGLSACGARTSLRVGDASADRALDAQADQWAPDAVVDVTIDSPLDSPLDSSPDVTPDARFDCRPDPVARCDDRSECTVDRCQDDGLCAHETIRCDDEDPCTMDRCEPSRGCVFAAFECGGCADGARDAFRDRARYPNIAGCAGGFELPGLNLETAPTCARIAGDDGPNVTGRGCRASDLCAEGFHVCRSAGEVRARAIDGCDGARDGDPGAFWATRQTGPGCLQCATGTELGCTNRDCRTNCAPTATTTNDIFGCGSVGSVPAASCGPLNRSGNNLCSALPAPWRCSEGAPDVDGRESEFVVKPGPLAGGVLCCRD